MCQDGRSLFMDWASSRQVFAGPCLSFLPLKKKRGSGSVPLPISLSYMHRGTGTAHLFRSGCPKLFISFTSRVIGLSADTVKLQVLLSSDCNLFYTGYCGNAPGGSESDGILNKPNSCPYSQPEENCIIAQLGYLVRLTEILLMLGIKEKSSAMGLAEAGISLEV